MSGVREIDIEISISAKRDQWDVTVSCPKKREITGQELLDVIADALLAEGELSPFDDRDPRKFDA
jgi:hypothetical protein